MFIYKYHRNILYDLCEALCSVMLRFFPAAIVSLALWAVIVQSFHMAYISMNQFFGTVGGILSVALF